MPVLLSTVYSPSLLYSRLSAVAWWLGVLLVLDYYSTSPVFLG